MTIAVLAVAILLYGLAYGVARWRKCIIMREYIAKEEALQVRHTGPGWDIRENWRGKLKNEINPYLFTFFRPLSSIEDFVRGFKNPLDRTTPRTVP